jgi:hypothetical protein
MKLPVPMYSPVGACLETLSIKKLSFYTFCLIKSKKVTFNTENTETLQKALLFIFPTVFDN